MTRLLTKSVKTSLELAKLPHSVLVSQLYASDQDPPGQRIALIPASPNADWIMGALAVLASSNQAARFMPSIWSVTVGPVLERSTETEVVAAAATVTVTVWV